MTVSVIIPAFDAAKTIRHALDSALAQTYPVHEIVVVDDGSRDDTPALVASYGRPVRLLRQSNQGPSVARNRGVAAATGDWVAFLDSDDAFAREKLALQRAVVAARPEVRLVYGGVRLMRDGREVSERAAVPADRIWPALRYRNPIVPSTVLLSREAFLRVGGFDPSLIIVEDWDLWLKVFHAYGASAFRHVDAPVSDYALSEGSLSSDPVRLHECRLDMLDRLLRGTRGLERVRLRRTILAFFYIDAAIALRERHDPRCLGFAVRSLAEWPFPGEVLPVRRYAVLLSMLEARVGSWRRLRTEADGSPRA